MTVHEAINLSYGLNAGRMRGQNEDDNFLWFNEDTSMQLVQGDHNLEAAKKLVHVVETLRAALVGHQMALLAIGRDCLDREE